MRLRCAPAAPRMRDQCTGNEYVVDDSEIGCNDVNRGWRGLQATTARAILQNCAGGGAFRTPPGCFLAGAEPEVILVCTYIPWQYVRILAIELQLHSKSASWTAPLVRRTEQSQNSAGGEGAAAVVAQPRGAALITCQSGPAWTLSNFASTLCYVQKVQCILSLVLTHFGSVLPRTWPWKGPVQSRLSWTLITVLELPDPDFSLSKPFLFILVRSQIYNF